jgi:hypothetical protein
MSALGIMRSLTTAGDRSDQSPEVLNATPKRTSDTEEGAEESREDKRKTASGAACTVTSNNH